MEKIGLEHFEIFGAICQFLPSFWPSCWKIFTIYPLKLRGYWTKVHQIFKQYSDFIAAVNASIYIAIFKLFVTLEQTIKVVNFDVCERPQKLISY